MSWVITFRKLFKFNFWFCLFPWAFCLFVPWNKSGFLYLLTFFINVNQLEVLEKEKKLLNRGDTAHWQLQMDGAHPSFGDAFEKTMIITRQTNGRVVSDVETKKNVVMSWGPDKASQLFNCQAESQAKEGPLHCLFQAAEIRWGSCIARWKSRPLNKSMQPLHYRRMRPNQELMQFLLNLLSGVTGSFQLNVGITDRFYLRFLIWQYIIFVCWREEWWVHL